MRKFDFLLEKNEKKKYLSNETIVVSYGGIQSNAMAAISSIVANSPGCQFFYFVQRFPSYQKNNPNGNLLIALQNGMKVTDVGSSTYKRLQTVPKSLHGFQINDWKEYFPESMHNRPLLWIPQGGALPEAQIGVAKLGTEIAGFISANRASSNLSWKIFISSATGTTALYLARHLSTLLPVHECEVIAVPCVNPSELLFQMQSLSSSTSSPNSSLIFPALLPLPTTIPFIPFAQPSLSQYRIWESLNSAAKSAHLDDMIFDLIYAPKAFELIQLSSSSPETKDLPLWKDYREGRNRLVYYHCGGVEGNESQLRRYQRMELLKNSG